VSEENSKQPAIEYSRDPEGALLVRLSGDWRMQQGGLPDTTKLREAMAKGESKGVLLFDLGQVGEWDTCLVATLYRLVDSARQQDMECMWQGAPDGVANLLKMATRRKPNEQEETTQQFDLIEWAGSLVLKGRAASERVLNFIGEVVLSFGRLLKHKAYFRRVDFQEALADVGPRALPIVTLISFLVGLILAFVGAMQLRQFGAQVFVANLVGIAMAREMGAMMTGIIMAGRTGASYAARLGTMQVNEEVDALRTNGIEPMDFLTLPRILALVIMVPLLSVYAMAIGILGGMTIGVVMLDLTAIEYWNQTMEAVPLNHFWAGLIKSVVFAFVIGIAGCYHGLRCGRSSESVGKVTTVAVVSAIVFIIITDSLLTVVYDVIDF
jgi:phospholipid/cholesterol/gamma-HCH transport system permease protein